MLQGMFKEGTLTPHANAWLNHAMLTKPKQQRSKQFFAVYVRPPFRVVAQPFFLNYYGEE